MADDLHPKDNALDRASEPARLLMRQDRLVRRYSRVALTADVRRRMQSLLGYGLAVEGLAHMRSS